MSGLSGYRKLKAGRIHLLCPTCGRKQSNMPREDYDPESAAIAEIQCPKCADGPYGGKDAPTFYYDAHGKDVSAEAA